MHVSGRTHVAQEIRAVATMVALVRQTVASAKDAGDANF